MGEAKKRKVHTAEFKAKVGLEAIRGIKTISEIAQSHAWRSPGKVCLIPPSKLDQQLTA